MIVSHIDCDRLLTVDSPHMLVIFGAAPITSDQLEVWDAIGDLVAVIITEPFQITKHVVPEDVSSFGQ